MGRHRDAMRQRYVDQFRGEVEAKLQASLENLRTALKEIDEMGLPKGKAARLKQRIQHTYIQLASNLPYVAEQLGKHMEETVEKAKAEIHGYMTGVVQRAGLDALTNGVTPLQIEYKDDERD